MKKRESFAMKSQCYFGCCGRLSFVQVFSISLIRRGKRLLSCVHNRSLLHELRLSFQMFQVQDPVVTFSLFPPSLPS